MTDTPGPSPLPTRRSLDFGFPEGSAPDPETGYPGIVPVLSMLDQAASLRQRLAEIAPHILDAAQPRELEPAEMLPALVDRVRHDDSLDLLWLLLTGMSGAFPYAEELHATSRALRRMGREEATHEVLRRSREMALDRGWPGLPIRVVANSVVVEASVSAQSNRPNDAQRIVVETLPRWRATDKDFTVVAWNDEKSAMRALRSPEHTRIFDWAKTPPEASRLDRYRVAIHDELIIPWRSRLILFEVAAPQEGRALQTLAEHSGNAVSAVGYGMSPINSVDLREQTDPTNFTRYLAVIKHADVIVGISAATAQEFRGFSGMLTSQGVKPPRVLTIPLPTDTMSTADTIPVSRARDRARPLVLVLGPHNPGANHEAILYAAETLWREGIAFDLGFVGEKGRQSRGTCIKQFQRRDRVRRQRPILEFDQMSDVEVLETMRSAAFTVSVPLHEPFGRAAASSLAAGTPAIITGYGSLHEIGVEGGCLEVDPRDDADLCDAMRKLLAHPEALEELRRSIGSRPRRTWDDYASDLWAALVTTESSQPCP